MNRDTFARSGCSKLLSHLTLNISWVGVSTASLGECLTTLTVKNFFLISSLNLLSFSLKTFSCHYMILKNLFPSFL